MRSHCLLRSFTVSLLHLTHVIVMNYIICTYNSYVVFGFESEVCKYFTRPGGAHEPDP